MAERLLPLREVLNRTGQGRTRWYDLMADGKAPKPIRPHGSTKQRLWLESEVDAYITATVLAARNRRS